MVRNTVGKQIDDLIQAERWEDARLLIEQALKNEPQSHWLLTQLAETYYEQRQYKKALGLLLRSRDIIPDCPLTLWHLAGTLDALGHSPDAIRLYAWLLVSTKTPEDDPCWESVARTEALKTDCVFRMGLCFQHLRSAEQEAHCFRKYIELLDLGMDGSYPADDARKHLTQSSKNGRKSAEYELRDAADWIVRESGNRAHLDSPPEIDIKRLQELQQT